MRAQASGSDRAAAPARARSAGPDSTQDHLVPRPRPGSPALAAGEEGCTLAFPCNDGQGRRTGRRSPSQMTRMILSRKGFDGKAGGGASPILPDGRMLSLPIPNAADELRFQDLAGSGVFAYSDALRLSDPTRIRIAGANPSTAPRAFRASLVARSSSRLRLLPSPAGRDGWSPATLLAQFETQGIAPCRWPSSPTDPAAEW
jgi:hypothetical protein